MATVKGGSIHGQDPDNYASVLTATATKTPAVGNWVVVLKAAPVKGNYKPKEKLVYNTANTHNPNANNYLVVTNVLGPAKYKCTGLYPINT